jgi:hypothetical protein
MKIVLIIVAGLALSACGLGASVGGAVGAGVGAAVDVVL